MSRNPEMMNRKFTESMTFERYMQLWNELANELSRLGPRKSIKEWQKVNKQ